MVWQSELLGTEIDHRIRLQPSTVRGNNTYLDNDSLCLSLYIIFRSMSPSFLATGLTLTSGPPQSFPPNKDERRRREDDESNWLPVVLSIFLRNHAGESSLLPDSPSYFYRVRPLP